MAFVFALSAVLMVRRQREEAEERRLQEAVRELGEARRTLEWVRGEVTRAAAERDGTAAGVVGALELRERYARLAVLEGARVETEARVASAEARVAERRPAYLQARRERELLEEMEARQRTFYRIEALRREARRTEDLLLGRRMSGVGMEECS